MEAQSNIELACGHRQVVSVHRARLAASGVEQHSVWCVACDAWSRLVPQQAIDNQENTSGTE